MLGKFIRRFLPIGGGKMQLSPGDPVPAFECSDDHGRTVSSLQLAGERYVLWFYPMADTPG